LAHDPQERAALRRELRPRLGQIGVSLQLLAENALGEEDEPIDWLATLPDGRALVGLVALAAGDGALLAQGLAQRAWVRARIPDWQQLAPGLIIRPEIAPILLLLAPEFPRLLRIAAREADAQGIRLVRYQWRAGHRGPELALDVAEAPPAPSREPRSAPRLVSVFRSGLTEGDFDGESLPRP